MKKPLLYSFLLIWALLHVCFTGAQQTNFNKVTPPHGGFNGSISCFAQDKNGYIWIATFGGFYKNDGYRFKRYVHDPANPNTPGGIQIELVYADREGTLWIAPWNKGLDRFDPITETFKHFRHDPGNPQSLSCDSVKSILEDREGTLWIGSNEGLDKYDPKTNTFYNYHHDAHDPNSISCNNVRKLYEDREGTLWVGTGSIWPGEGGETEGGGLNRFDKKTGKFIRYLHDSNNPHSLINNKVNAIHEDSRGIFWVGTAGDGLHTMDRKTGIFQRHTYDPAHPEKLSRPPVKNVFLSDYITALTEDALGGIWIGTLENGISRYDPKENRVVHYTSKDSAVGFTDNSGWTFYNSKDGVLWIGTFDGGAYRMNPYHKNIPHVYTGIAANAFQEDADQNLWIGTIDGLLVQNRTTGTLKKFVHDPRNSNSLGDNTVTSLLRDHEGTLWVGTQNGLNRFNEQSHAFTHYVNNPKDSNSIGVGGIVLEDGGGDSLWVGSNDGLDLMNKRTGTLIHFRNDPKDTNTLPLYNISALLKDKMGKVWVGISPGGGLNYLDPVSRKCKHFLKGLSIYSLLRDASGTLWAGTQEDGIYRSNQSGTDFIKYTDPGVGIEKVSVDGIVQDNQNNIWANTNSGFYRINAQTGQSTLFDLNYGIDPASLFSSSGYKGEDGKIYFGNVNGYFVFAPEQIVTSPTLPQIVFTGFRIGGRSVVPGKGSPLTEPLEQTKRITLNHDQNVIAFDFAGIHYSSPEGNRHLYKLENYDPEWREAGVEKTASYFNVPPGHYTFKVKAASSNGVWAERDVQIIISPPWWRTWWAYSLYAILFLTVVFAFDRIQRRRIVERERARAKERELAQAREIEKAYNELKRTQNQLIQSEKMASLGELTAGIAHEIQNPLNFVNNFSEVNNELVDELKQQAQSGHVNEVLQIADEIKNNGEKINQHGKRADAIVKNMLQHSRRSTGEKQPTDINALADEYLRLSYHGFRAKDKSFNAIIYTDFDNSIGKINIIPQDIGRVLLNLFNNAFYSVSEKKKRVPEGYEPKVSVITRQVEKRFEIQVWDNGIGIPQKILDKIFQPFFTTKPTGEGTGLGLSLSYDIVKTHGGEIKVNSKEGEGAEFIVQLPLQS